MNLKKYLPLEAYTLLTHLSGREVYERLSENVEPKKRFRISGFKSNATKPYEGEVSEDSFTISRIISYRNSFLPIVRGEIYIFQDQTQLRIKMQPVTFVLIFMSFWLGLIGLVCIGILLAGFLHLKHILQNGFSPALLFPFGMFAFGYLLMSLAFKAESRKTKAFLASLLNGQEYD